MISACLIVKNEEKYLRDCILSIINVVDEIIVVDTGSSDKTVEIAGEFNSKIFYFNWIGDFSAARNYGLEQAAGDWILYIDADERLSKSSFEEIKSLTSSNKKIAYRCNVISVDNYKKHPSIMSYVRLFPRDNAIKFSGKVHEQIEAGLLRNKILIKNSSIEIIHLGYNVSYEEIKIKAERNLKLLIPEYNTSPSGYYAYQIGQTMAILEQKEKAEIYFLKALEDSKLLKEYRSVAYRYLAVNSAERKEYEKSLSLIEMSLNEDEQQPLNLIAAAKIYARLNYKEKAADCALKAYHVNKRFIEEKLSSAQNILIDQNELCGHGLDVAILSLNKELFGFFYDKLPYDLEGSSKNIFYDLYNGNSIDEAKVTWFVDQMNQSYLDSILFLLENYKCNSCKLFFLTQLTTRFPANPYILVQLGKANSEAGNLEDSIKAFEQSITLQPEEPSFYFYLISVFLRNSKYSQIKLILRKMDYKFAALPEVKSRIDSLTKKLNPYLN